MKKFKIGDKAKVRKHHIEESCDDTGCAYFESRMKKYFGKRVTISDIHGSHYHIKEDGEVFAWSDCMLEKSRGRPAKPKPALFAAIYDERGRDPVKKFTSKAGLNKWLKEAFENENIVFSSIEVIEVKNLYKVKTNFSLAKV